MKKIGIYLCMLLFHPSLVCLFSQNTPVEYTFGFEFVEGVYLSHKEFKNNNPSIREYEMVSGNTLFVDLTIGNTTVKKVDFKDSMGNWQTIKRRDIWGICYRDNIYVNIHGKFFQISQYGAIMSIKMKTIVGYRRTNQLGINSEKTWEMQLELLDFATGNIILLDEVNVLPILKRDSGLYKRYQADKKKYRPYKLMKYVLEYNQRNPIYFPVAE